jgi:hypothetical protein
LNVTTQMLMLMSLAAVDMAAATVVMHGGGIWDQSTFRMCCLIGSTGGAILSVLIWPDTSGTDKQTVRALATKVISSAIAGWCFTPLVMRWLGWTIDVDTVVGASCTTAFASVATLQMIAALWVKYGPGVLKAKIGTVVPIDDETKGKS